MIPEYIDTVLKEDHALPVCAERLDLALKIKQASRLEATGCCGGSISRTFTDYQDHKATCEVCRKG
jgi:hypothetical protein